MTVTRICVLHADLAGGLDGQGRSSKLRDHIEWDFLHLYLK